MPGSNLQSPACNRPVNRVAGREMREPMRKRAASPGICPR